MLNWNYVVVELLTELRIDENPFMRGSERTETRAFVIFCLTNLASLDGVEVSVKERY